MSEAQSAVPQHVLDGLAEASQQMGGVPQVEADTTEEVVEEPEEEIVAESHDDVPEDFKSYEQYIEDGGDPDFYRGPKAYKQQKEILDELKGVKERFKRLDDEQFKLQQLHDKEKQRLIKQLEEQKKQAREDLDFDKYDSLEQQRRELEEGPKPAAAEQQEHQVIASFRDENPQLNHAAPEFDPVYASAFAGAFNALVGEAQKRAGRDLTDSEIKRHLETVQQRLGGQQSQRRNPPKVEGARRPTKAQAPADKMPGEVKAMYDRWVNHSDPAKREYAKTLAKQYGG